MSNNFKGKLTRNQLAVELQRYLNANTPNKSILSTNNLADINQAAKLLKIVAGDGQGWRFKKGSKPGNYKNTSQNVNCDYPLMSRNNIMHAIHNYGQGSSNKNINNYVKNFRAPTPNYMWM
jgi:hypothetical protein